MSHLSLQLFPIKQLLFHTAFYHNTGFQDNNRLSLLWDFVVLPRTKPKYPPACLENSSPGIPSLPYLKLIHFLSRFSQDNTLCNNPASDCVPCTRPIPLLHFGKPQIPHTLLLSANSSHCTVSSGDLPCLYFPFSGCHRNLPFQIWK